MTHYTFKPAPTPAVCAVCGRAIRLTPYGWGHLVNPGRAHHYARPRREEKR